jgi:DNA adenine methylase
MTPNPDRLRPPVKTHGGKAYLARKIVALFPDGQKWYAEPFAGGLSVLLACPPFQGELANDYNPRVAAMWEVLRDYYEELMGRLMTTAYTEAAFERSRDFCLDHHHLETKLDLAFHWIVRSRMSRGGLGASFAWSDRERGGNPGDLNAWLTFLWAIPAISERVRAGKLKVTNRKAHELIADCDGVNTLLYCDPPYMPDTRTSRKAYGPFEMTVEDHLELLAALRRCQGKVVLSGYDNPLYRAALAGWRVARFDVPNHSGQGATKERRTECCWMNY